MTISGPNPSRSISCGEHECCRDAVVGRFYSLSDEVRPHLIDHRPLGLMLNRPIPERPDIGVECRATQTNLLSGPARKKLVAQRKGTEAQLLLVSKQVLEGALALVENRPNPERPPIP